MTDTLSPRFFNTTGPCRPDDHYMLPPQRRLPELRRREQVVRDGKTLHVGGS